MSAQRMGSDKAGGGKFFAILSGRLLWTALTTIISQLGSFDQAAN